MAYKRARRKPDIIITDKMRSYRRAIHTVFSRKTIHLTSGGFDSPTNTNLIERFHGILKQRTKVMRDLQGLDSAKLILKGFIVHYNFLHEHSSIEGITPAVKANINIGIDNWGDLIELALKYKHEGKMDNWVWMKEVKGRRRART